MATASLPGLPVSLLRHIIIYLSNDEHAVCQMACTCQNLQAVAAEDAIWNALHAQRWNGSRRRGQRSKLEYIRRHEIDRKTSAWIRQLATGDLAENRLAVLFGRVEPYQQDAIDVCWKLAVAENESLALQKMAKSVGRMLQCSCLVDNIVSLRRTRMLLGNANDRELTEVLATTLSSLFFDKPPFADAANQIRSSLDQIAETVRSRFIYPNPTVEHKMDALQRVFYEEMHFCGNTDDYYNIGNSLLHSTLERKTAIPLTLAILYQCIGRRIGVDVDIIGLPGHIVVGLPEMELYVDVFREGKLLTRDDCGTIVNGYGIDMNEEFLQPINATDVFLRNCNNLSNCLRRVTQYDTRVVAVQILRLAGGIPFEDTRACRESLPLMWARAHVQYGDRLPVW